MIKDIEQKFNEVVKQINTWSYASEGAEKIYDDIDSIVENFELRDDYSYQMGARQVFVLQDNNNDVVHIGYNVNDKKVYNYAKTKNQEL